MKLEATWPRMLRLSLELLWRFVLWICAIDLLKGAIGVYLGKVIGIFGFSNKTDWFLSLMAGWAIIFIGLIVSLTLMINRNFGDFRLVLIEKQEKIMNDDLPVSLR